MGEAISLGIQLCDTIREYVHDLNTRDEQLGTVLRRTQHLKHLLQHLDRHTQHASLTLPEASYNVSAAVASCEAELRALKDVVYELVPTPPLSDDRKGKMKEAVKKAMFPLKRADIERLERRLEKAAQVLSLAMDCLQLDSQFDFSSRQATMHDDISSIGSRQASFDNGLHKLDAGQREMHSDLEKLRIRLDEVHATMLSWTTAADRTRGQAVTIDQPSPSVLREMCDVVANHKVLTRDRYTRVSPLLLAVSLEEEVAERHVHRPDCVYAKFRPTETSRRLALTYTGLRQYLSKAVSIGFRSEHGAGGHSISPVLRYSRTVDSRTSPVFVLMGRMALALSYCTSRSMGLQLVDRGVETLQNLYAAKQALPTDINEKGATALTLFCFRGDLTAGLEDFRWSVVDKLLDLEVPTQGIGSNATALPAVHQLLWHYTHYALDCPLVDVLPKLMSRSEGNFMNSRYKYDSAPHPLSFMSGSPEDWEDVADVYGLESPLSMALLHQDEAKLMKVLSQRHNHPLSLIENHTQLLEFTVIWPAGLEILVRDPSATNIDAYLSNGNTVPMAMQATIRMCTSGRCAQSILCEEGCSCTRALKILLERGSIILLSLIPWRACSLRAVQCLLSHIRHWREALTELARSELSPDEQVDLGLDADSVLDHNTNKVVRFLQRRGVLAGERLGLRYRDDRLNDSDKPFSGSIYHGFDMTSFEAEIAFSLGFGDIDSPNDDNATPLARFVHIHAWLNPWRSEWFHSRSMKYGVSYISLHTNYMAWLMDKGACVGHPLRYWHWDGHRGAWLTHTAHTILHQLAAMLGVLGILSQHGLEPWLPPSRLVEEEAIVKDLCKCTCSDSSSGCSPLQIFLKHFTKSCLDAGYSLPRVISTIEAYLGPDVTVAMTAAIPRILVRLLAFESLGLRHTCCFEWLHKGYTYLPQYEDDFDEIRLEDACMAERLEDLVGTLTTRFEQSDSGSIFRFLEDGGLQCIQDAVNDVSGADLMPEEREGIEEVGVRLVYGPVVEESVGTTVDDRRLCPRKAADTYAFWAEEFTRIRAGDYSQPDFDLWNVL